MKFFVDENFPKSSVEYLISQSQVVYDIRKTKNEGIADSEIFSLAQREKAVFLTTDKDFYHTIPYLYPNHFGVIVIALRQPNSKSILERLKWFLENYISDINNKIYLLKDNSYFVK